MQPLTLGQKVLKYDKHRSATKEVETVEKAEKEIEMMSRNLFFLAITK